MFWGSSLPCPSKDKLHSLKTSLCGDVYPPQGMLCTWLRRPRCYLLLRGWVEWNVAECPRNQRLCRVSVLGVWVQEGIYQGGRSISQAQVIMLEPGNLGSTAPSMPQQQFGINGTFSRN